MALLKILPLIPLHKILLLDPTSDHSKSFVVSAFMVILTQSLMKPIMKVFSLSNVISILKIFWIRKKLIKGDKPLMTQEELNEIFSKPKCYLKNLYCEDIYITTIAFMTSAYNPGVAIACLIYFILKTFADRLLFLRFYAEPEVDSHELSSYYFMLFRFLIAFSTVHAFLRFSVFGFPEIEIGGLDYTIKGIFLVIIIFPYELPIEYILGRVDQKHLIRRTEKSEELLSLAEEGKIDGFEEGLAEGGNTILSKDEYYKGVSDLAEVPRERLVSETQEEFSRISIL